MLSQKDIWESILVASGERVRAHGRFKGIHTNGPIRVLGPHVPNSEREFWRSESEHYHKWETPVISTNVRKRRRKFARQYLSYKAQEKCLYQMMSTKGRYLIIASTKPKERKIRRAHERSEKRFQAFEQKPRPPWTKAAIRYSRKVKIPKKQWLSLEKNAPIYNGDEVKLKGKYAVTLEYIKHLYPV